MNGHCGNNKLMTNFHQHRTAVLMAKRAYYPISAARNETSGISIFTVGIIPNEDELLSCVVADKPGGVRLATLPVTLTIEADKTWEEIGKEYCFNVKTLKPCGAELTDTADIIIATVNWMDDSFNGVDGSKDVSIPRCLYYDVIRTASPGPKFISGDFILRECA